MSSKDSVVTEVVQDLIKRLEATNFRFAVGSPQHGYSGTWTAFGNGGDFYIGARPLMGSTKISLHASRKCRIALTEQRFKALPGEGLSQPTDRALMKWERAETPENGTHLAVSLLFPTDYLRAPEPVATLTKPLLIFEAASAGHAVEIGFFYSRASGETLDADFRRIGIPINTTKLDSGDYVTAAVRTRPFDPSVLPSQEQMDRSQGHMLSKDVYTIETERGGLTGIFWNAPAYGEPCMVVEIGGLAVRRAKLLSKE
jgi:hypothetical protein